MVYWMLILRFPETDGDSTPLGQRPLSVLPIVYRVWASARMGQLEDWFKSWVLDSVFSAGGGRGSVEAWYTSALTLKKFFVVPLILIFICLLLMLLNLLILLIGRSWIGCQVVLGYLVGFVMLILSIMVMFGEGLNWLLALESLGLVMVGSLRAVL